MLYLPRAIIWLLGYSPPRNHEHETNITHMMIILTKITPYLFKLLLTLSNSEESHFLGFLSHTIVLTKSNHDNVSPLVEGYNLLIHSHLWMCHFAALTELCN